MVGVHSSFSTTVRGEWVPPQLFWTTNGVAEWLSLNKLTQEIANTPGTPGTVENIRCRRNDQPWGFTLAELNYLSADSKFAPSGSDHNSWLMRGKTWGWNKEKKRSREKNGRKERKTGVWEFLHSLRILRLVYTRTSTAINGSMVIEDILQYWSLK